MGQIMRSPTSKRVGTAYTCMWCVCMSQCVCETVCVTNLPNFSIILLVMVRNPNMGYFFLNKVNTLPLLLGHSFSTNLNMVFVRLHIIPQYCAKAIACCCRRTLCFSDISKATPETTHTHTYIHVSLLGGGAGGGEQTFIGFSPRSYCRIFGV